jgi:hypothetical protein
MLLNRLSLGWGFGEYIGVCGASCFFVVGMKG